MNNKSFYTIDNTMPTLITAFKVFGLFSVRQMLCLKIESRAREQKQRQPIKCTQSTYYETSSL